MAGQRFIGLSKHQSVPPLLSRIGNKPSSQTMRDVPDDAPPLSSSDCEDSGNEQPTSEGDSRPSLSATKSSADLDPFDTLSIKKATEAPVRRKRSRASTRSDIPPREPSSSSDETGRQSNGAKPGNNSSSPAAKKIKKDSTGFEELGSQFADDIFAMPLRGGVKKHFGGSRSFATGRVRKNSPPAKRGFIPPPKDSTPDTSPEKPRTLQMPSSPQGTNEESSPVRAFKAVPSLERSSPAASPVRKRRLKMPEKDSFTTEESQRPVFKMPDEIPEPLIGDESADLEFTVSPTINDRPATERLSERSTSPLTDLEDLIPTPLCPLCNKEVDGDLLSDFKAKHPRMTVSQMQKFCYQHRKRSAQQAWHDRGYPDIEWSGLDARIAKRHPALRAILEGRAASHYDDLFRDRVRAGQDRTLLRSDANLTPGYYGIRGLRAMSENLIREFSALLRQRALQDRVVSARGHTAYVQSVLVPELAVRLIMEDMDVGAEEARGILKESCWVGELLNDEIADVVADEESDEEREGREG